MEPTSIKVLVVYSPASMSLAVASQAMAGRESRGSDTHGEDESKECARVSTLRRGFLSTV